MADYSAITADDSLAIGALRWAASHGDEDARDRLAELFPDEDDDGDDGDGDDEGEPKKKTKKKATVKAGGDLYRKRRPNSNRYGRGSEQPDNVDSRRDR